MPIIERTACNSQHQIAACVTLTIGDTSIAHPITLYVDLFDGCATSADLSERGLIQTEATKSVALIRDLFTDPDAMAALEAIAAAEIAADDAAQVAA